MPEARVRAVLRAVASALGALHGAGVLCCDLKTENVVLLEEDEVWGPW